MVYAATWGWRGEMVYVICGMLPALWPLHGQTARAVDMDTGLVHCGEFCQGKFTVLFWASLRVASPLFSGNTRTVEIGFDQLRVFEALFRKSS